MNKICIAFLLLITCHISTAQIRQLGQNGLGGLNGNSLNSPVDSLNNDEITVKLSGKTKYTDYKIISQQYDTTYVDTTLTIKKEYIFNFRRKDNFELLPFHNQGQTFNNLAYDFTRTNPFPDIGFRAKQFNYLREDEVNYYNVPTPTTEILYRTGQEQGQVLDTWFTLNFSKRFNVSISYRGLRSLGHYRRSLASSGCFVSTISYQTPKNQYAVRFYVAKQIFTNQESGGLTAESLKNFVTENPNFENRARLDVVLTNTENILEGDRIYIDHNYKLFASKDSTNTKDFSNLKIGHSFMFKEKTYAFSQSEETPKIFGETDFEGAFNNKTDYFLLNNQAYLEFNSKYVLGRFKVKANYTQISYGYDAIINTKNPTDKIGLKGEALSLGANWRGRIGNFQIKATANLTPGSGHLAGTNFNGEALYKKDSVYTVKGRLALDTKTPNFNFKLFQSRYNNYNWSTNFSSISTRNIGFSFLSKWGNAMLDFTNIENYTYFDETNKPQQFKSSITYLKLKINKEFKVGKFALNNTVMYQNVSSGSSVFRVPELVTRNTFYYTDDWFKGKAMLVNIGVTFNYFNEYYANAYNPLLAEFTIQNQTKIGYPTLDFFFNARVRRTRLYFKIDNVTSIWTNKNYFSAPNYPYRDFSIRFGLVWNWFI